jgi:hypothetical protein
MRFWFDTEFIEDGKTIDLVSIGILCEDGRTYYAEAAECDHSRADEWVRENVLSNLDGGDSIKPRAQIAADIVAFVGEAPEFWAFYGRMIDLPKGWPMYCRDIKQLCDDLGNPPLPRQSANAEHNAMQDAHWNWRAWDFLQRMKKAA